MDYLLRATDSGGEFIPKGFKKLAGGKSRWSGATTGWEIKCGFTILKGLQMALPYTAEWSAIPSALKRFAEGHTIRWCAVATTG